MLRLAVPHLAISLACRFAPKAHSNSPAPCDCAFSNVRLPWIWALVKKVTDADVSFSNATRSRRHPAVPVKAADHYLPLPTVSSESLLCFSTALPLRIELTKIGDPTGATLVPILTPRFPSWADHIRVLACPMWDAASPQDMTSWSWSRYFPVHGRPWAIRFSSSRPSVSLGACSSHLRDYWPAAGNWTLIPSATSWAFHAFAPSSPVRRSYCRAVPSVRTKLRSSGILTTMNRYVWSHPCGRSACQAQHGNLHTFCWWIRSALYTEYVLKTQRQVFFETTLASHKLLTCTLIFGPKLLILLL